jgi:hypothetical protein
VKRACKKHRLCTFTLLSMTGQHIMSATHLPGLAQRLKVGMGRLGAAVVRRCAGMVMCAFCPVLRC